MNTYIHNIHNIHTYVNVFKPIYIYIYIYINCTCNRVIFLNIFLFYLQHWSLASGVVGQGAAPLVVLDNRLGSGYATGAMETAVLES